MTDLITRELTGKPITVTIGGRELPVSYPMHNILLFKQQTGLSLFAGSETWAKIDFLDDFPTWLRCLWAGLHQRQADLTWKAPFTLEELELLVGLNAITISAEMTRALVAFLPLRKDADPEPEESKKKTEAPILTTSAGSGSAQIGD